MTTTNTPDPMKLMREMREGEATAADVARALGLKPFAAAELDAVAGLLERRAQFGDDACLEMIRSKRGTGRTTRTACLAIAHVMAGRHVVLAGGSPSKTEHVWTVATDFARRLGLDPLAIGTYSNRTRGSVNLGNAVFVEDPS